MYIYAYVCIHICIDAIICTHICINVRLVNPQGLDLIYVVCLHLGACPRAFTATRKIICALLCKTSLRSAEKLARPARPELGTLS